MGGGLSSQPQHSSGGGGGGVNKAVIFILTARCVSVLIGCCSALARLDLVVHLWGQQQSGVMFT